jgi:hypothetical protein
MQRRSRRSRELAGSRTPPHIDPVVPPCRRSTASRAIASRVVYWHFCWGDPARVHSTSTTTTSDARHRLGPPARKTGFRMTTQPPGRRQAPQLIPHRLLRSGQIHHPAVLAEARRRREDFQLRLADRITSLAKSTCSLRNCIEGSLEHRISATTPRKSRQVLTAVVEAIMCWLPIRRTLHNRVRSGRRTPRRSE